MRYRIRNEANNGWADACDDQIRLRNENNNAWANISNAFVTRRIRMSNNTWKDLDCLYPCGFELKFSNSGSYYPETFNIGIEPPSAANQRVAVITQAFTVPDLFELDLDTAQDTGLWRGNKDRNNWDIIDSEIPGATPADKENWLDGQINIRDQIGYDVLEQFTKVAPTTAFVRVNSAFNNTGFWTTFVCESPTSLRTVDYNTVSYIDGSTLNGSIYYHGITIDGEPIIAPNIEKLTPTFGNNANGVDRRVIKDGPALDNSFTPTQRFRALKTSTLNTIHVSFPNTVFNPPTNFPAADVRNLVGGTLIKTVGPNVLAGDAYNIFTFNINQVFGDGLAIEFRKETP